MQFFNMIPQAGASGVYSPYNQAMTIADDVDFVYIMRTDSTFVIEELLARLARHHIAYGKVQVFYAAYDSFTQALMSVLQRYLTSKGTMRIDVYEAADLESRLRRKAGPLPIVSLDPLISRRAYSFATSRIYHPGGFKLYKQTNRPGTPSLARQAIRIKAFTKDIPVCVVDDDTYTGGSLVTAMQALADAKVYIQKVCVGIQIGEAEVLAASGVESDPCVRYVLADTSQDMFSKVDLGDPRDFLVGAGGLVVALPGQRRGRAPYMLPYASPAARLQIVATEEQGFSIDMLRASYDFYHTIHQATGLHIELRHVDPFFRGMLVENYGANPSLPMTAIIDDAMRRLPEIWAHTKLLAHPRIKKYV